MAHAEATTGVVIQVSDADPAKWNLALNNARNLVAAMGGADKLRIEIVAYGPGLDMMRENSPVGERLGTALSEGVLLTACGNTMEKQKVSASDLYLGVRIVAAGVKEIVERQQQGWAYIRP